MFIPGRTCKTALALITVIFLAITLHGQNHQLRAQFDSLYDKALRFLPADILACQKCLETLTAAGEPLSEMQNARIELCEAYRQKQEYRKGIGLIGNLLLIRYSDNGKGFNTASEKKTGMGLLNITNRVESSGGTLSIDSAPEAGILVNITIPV